MPNQNVNKVIYGGRVLIDLTGDTVDPSKLLKGSKAHDKSGAQIEGACPSYKGLFRRWEGHHFDRGLWEIRCNLKPLRVGYFCIIPTLWLKKPVITGYFASIIPSSCRTDAFPMAQPE